MTFKIGDRVRAIKAVDGRKELIGEVGEVIIEGALLSDCKKYSICVEFDKNIELGYGRKGINCLLGNEDEFELIKEDDVETFEEMIAKTTSEEGILSEEKPK